MIKKFFNYDKFFVRWFVQINNDIEIFQTWIFENFVKNFFFAKINEYFKYKKKIFFAKINEYFEHEKKKIFAKINKYFEHEKKKIFRENKRIF